MRQVKTRSESEKIARATITKKDKRKADSEVQVFNGAGLSSKLTPLSLDQKYLVATCFIFIVIAFFVIYCAILLNV